MPEYKMKLTVEAVAKNKEELEKVKQQLDGIQSGGPSAGQGLKELAKDALGSITALGVLEQTGKKVIEYLKESVRVAAEGEMAEVRRNAVFNATNATTRTSIELLDQYAASLSQTTYVDDELILKQEELLLQFRSLSGELLPQTLQAAIDMAGGFEGDVMGATESLGRALELISQGGSGATMALSTLRRQSVILDTATQETIIGLAEQGKVTEAQTALLNALADIMGGRAAAAADTMLGAEQRLNNALENQKEIVGTDLANAWKTFTNWRASNIEKSNALYEITGSMTDAERKALYMRAQAAGMDVLAYAQQTQAKEETGKASEDLIENAIDPEIERTRDLESAKRMLAAALSGDLTKAIEQHKSQLAELTARGKELEEEYRSLIANGYAPTSEKVLEVKAAMSENTDAIAKQNAELRKNTALMIFNNAAAHLDARGQLELAKAFGLANVKDLEAAVAIEELTAKYDANKDGVVSAAEGAEKYAKDLEELRRRLLSIPPYIETEVFIQYTESGTPPPGGGCFLAGTLIAMADGTRRPIERVEVGDWVMSYDFKADEVVTARVQETFHHTPEETGRYLVINHKLRVTPNHLIWTQNRDWVGAGTLQLGDQLENIEGAAVVITHIHIVDENVPVYNLHIDHVDHNYYANNILVHNGKTQDTGGGLGFSSGADFIVPPGYPNDSFPFRAQSGERVIVIPAERATGPGMNGSSTPAGNSVVIQNLNVQGLTFDEILQRVNDAGGRL